MSFYPPLRKPQMSSRSRPPSHIQNDDKAATAHGGYPAVRMRRNRKAAWSRRLVAEHRLSASDLIWPMFVSDGKGQRSAVASMPGVERLSVDLIVEAAQEAARTRYPGHRALPVHRSRKTHGRRARSLQRRQSRLPRDARRQKRQARSRRHSRCRARSLHEPRTRRPARRRRNRQRRDECGAR